MGATIAPAFQAPNWAMMLCGEFGSSSATRSPFLTPCATSAAPNAFVNCSRRAYDMRVPLKISAVWSGRWRTVSLITSSNVHSG